uniref:TruB pseudouridine (psi) synthase family member 2 n=1 Tax=Hucho hucho TaxID=62062 RepID=A0A4W5MAS6_9TELE
MTTASVCVFHKLYCFTIYKPPGVHWKLVRDTIETNLLKGINAAPPTAHHQQVHELTLSAAFVPTLAHHPLVSGPEFQYIRVGVGHRLDAFSLGVLVLGVCQANKALTDLYRSHVTRDYTLEGEFGMATDNFSHTGRLIERTTYDHIIRDKLEKVLAMMQGSNQKALLTYIHHSFYIPIDLYQFNPITYHTRDIQCLRKGLGQGGEVGLELRSTAVCKGVRHTRDGPFTVQHALTRQHWTAPDVIQAIQQSRKARKSKSTQPGEDTGTAGRRQEIEEEEAAVTGDSHRLHLVLTSKAFGS